MNGPIRVGVLTVSDRSFNGSRPDLSGPALVHALEERGWSVVTTASLPDEQDQL